MAKLNLSVAVGPYDRTRALIDGSVQIDGVTPTCMALSPEEIFFRAFRHAEFDICELSLSSFTVKTAQGDCPYVGVPAFVSRAFRHTSIYVRTDRIKKPEDLKGKSVGLPEYQLTANVWARAILQDDYGVKPSTSIGCAAASRRPARPEKISIKLPADVTLEDAPDGKSISTLLKRRRDRRLHRRRGRRRCRRIRRMSAGCFPILSQPPRTTSSTPAFSRSCIWSACGARSPSSIRGCPAPCSRRSSRPRPPRSCSLSDTSATKVTLPFVEERLAEARALMGEDFWSYGLAANRKTLETFLRHHHSQGLSPRLMKSEDLFHPGTHEAFKL